MTEPKICCTLTTAQLQRRRTEVLQPLKRLITAQTALPDGYAFTFEPRDECLESLLHFIQLERECCAFLRFQLTVEANGGPVTLELTGSEGAKAFIEAEIELTL